MSRTLNWAVPPDFIGVIAKALLQSRCVRTVADGIQRMVRPRRHSRL